jgi:hypothetical protein
MLECQGKGCVDMTPTGANGGLVEIARAVDSAGLEWWVDSGTLLGLVREGRPLDGDVDLDLGCWAESMPSLPDFIAHMSRFGFVTELRSFNGMVTKCLLTVPGSSRLPIDLQVWRRIDDIAFVPLTSVERSKFKPRSPAWWSFGVVRRLVVRSVNRLQLHGRFRFLDSRLRTLGIVKSSWQVPAHYFDLLEPYEVAGLTVPVPSPPEEYLRFRYGDWETPVSDWNFRRDDPAFVWEPPATHRLTPPLSPRVPMSLRLGPGWSRFRARLMKP